MQCQEQKDQMEQQNPKGPKQMELSLYNQNQKNGDVDHICYVKFQFVISFKLDVH